jgi:riboflavin kinase / FMN adenylyltransferase
MLIEEHGSVASLDEFAGELMQPLTFEGRVISGNRIGRTIGFPTANIAVSGVEPGLYGIYTTTLALEDGRSYAGVSNLGIKPTVGSDRPLLEIHIFDFEEDIYGTHVVAMLHDKLRPEQRFSSLEALQAQLATDIKGARSLMAAINSA